MNYGPRWKHGRSRFVRRVGCLFAVLLLLSAVGLTTLMSFALGRAGVQSGAIIAAGVIVLVVLFIFFAAMRRIGFPLGDIVTAADRVGSGDYSARVSERGHPSLRSVARAFNTMTVRLEANEQQRRNFMADIAHELRTPLAVVQGRLEGLIDGVYPRDDRQLRELLEETRILARLVEDLRTLANAEAGALTLRKEPTDLGVLIHDAASFAPDVVRVELPSELPLIDIDPLRIREVLINLISNAVRHSSSLSITAEVVGDRIVVKVIDNGSGIAEEDLPKIFDRFYKGVESRGSGLGLTIARNLVVAHGGQIHAESGLGRGTTITFSLPM